MVVDNDFCCAEVEPSTEGIEVVRFGLLPFSYDEEGPSGCFGRSDSPIRLRPTPEIRAGHISRPAWRNGIAPYRRATVGPRTRFPAPARRRLRQEPAKESASTPQAETDCAQLAHRRVGSSAWRGRAGQVRKREGAVLVPARRGGVSGGGAGRRAGGKPDPDLVATRQGVRDVGADAADVESAVELLSGRQAGAELSGVGAAGSGSAGYQIRAPDPRRGCRPRGDRGRARPGCQARPGRQDR